MLSSVYGAVRNLLNADATMLSLLGGSYVYVANKSSVNQIPCITIIQNTENSKKRVSYDLFKVRDNRAVIQIDIWSKLSFLEVITVANRVDELLIPNTVSDTWGWEKISDSDQFEEENRIYHKSVRYEFSYKITDT